MRILIIFALIALIGYSMASPLVDTLSGTASGSTSGSAGANGLSSIFGSAQKMVAAHVEKAYENTVKAGESVFASSPFANLKPNSNTLPTLPSLPKTSS